MSTFTNSFDQPDWSTANGPYGNRLISITQTGQGTTTSPKVYLGQGQSAVLQIFCGGAPTLQATVTVRYYDNTGAMAMFTQQLATLFITSNYVVAVPAWSPVLDVQVTVIDPDPAQFVGAVGFIGTVGPLGIVRTRSGHIFSQVVALGAASGQNFTNAGPSPGPAYLAVDSPATNWKVYAFVPGAPVKLIFAVGSTTGPSQLTVPILLPPQDFTLVASNYDAVPRTITIGILG